MPMVAADPRLTKAAHVPLLPPATIGPAMRASINQVVGSFEVLN
jgi:hypothetical protein